MEEKEVTSIGKITGELIGGFFLYALLFGFLYTLIFGFISAFMPKNLMILLAVIAIILQGITVLIIWRCSISTTFRKRSISSQDVPTVIRNLFIFTVVICIITAVFNFISVNREIDSKADLSYSSKFLSESKIAEYQKAIDSAKQQSYIYLAVLEIGLLIVYLGAVPLQRKLILKYAV